MRIEHLAERLLLRKNQSALRRRFVDRRHKHNQIIRRNQVADDKTLLPCRPGQCTEHLFERMDPEAGFCAGIDSNLIGSLRQRIKQIRFVQRKNKRCMLLPE